MVSVVEPDDDVQRVLWPIAVIVIGVVVTFFAVLTVRDMTVPDGRIDRYAGPALIVSALAITGVSNLWSLLVAVSATGAALPPDAIGYIGNATVLGVLLGLGSSRPRGRCARTAPSSRCSDTDVPGVVRRRWSRSPS